MKEVNPYAAPQTMHATNMTRSVLRFIAQATFTLSGILAWTLAMIFAVAYVELHHRGDFVRCVVAITIFVSVVPYCVAFCKLHEFLFPRSKESNP